VNQAYMLIFYDIYEISDGIINLYRIWPSYTRELNKVRSDFYFFQFIYERSFLRAGKVGIKSFLFKPFIRFNKLISAPPIIDSL